MQRQPESRQSIHIASLFHWKIGWQISFLQTADHDVYKEKHVTVCDFLGVSYRHLLYVFAQFCEKGFLKKKEGTSYRIKRQDELSRLAEMLKNE